ncbi:OLC1v1039004C2 [Oldenlandia corymbosa var. corymbosa]|uniref:OLC1v1039004C2 n=1 Tax=Oldenlandia corymbosa var. corymbosa TaxID=529605 RepID=A0AAV1D136_OLDCO|nr:OLC1v1039004C2 [Oldenlandia corymbosa var. corymbosa]
MSNCSSAVFNTNTNQTVIQTYNATTYKNCSIDDALDSDTFQYQGGENEFGKPITIVVALTKEGPQYYFSGADDGIQCQHGMAFEISVGHGLGLPPSLNQPPPPPYVEPPTTTEEGQTPTTTIVSRSPNSNGVTIGAHLSWMVLMSSLALYPFVERA